MGELTKAQRQILNVLAAQPAHHALLTAREISRECEHRSSVSDWAHAKLRKLEARGLIEKVGIAFDNARTPDVRFVAQHLAAAGLAVVRHSKPPTPPANPEPSTEE